MRRRHKRLRRKEIRKRRTMVIISMFAATFLLASGYAAFSTSLNINAKGNLKEKANTTIGGKKVYLSTSGDGLYTDPVEENRYVYKGANPDNYICLETGSGICSEGNMYRIIAKEADGTLKVIKNTSIGLKNWDLGYATSISDITNASSVNGTRHSSIPTDFCYVSSISSYYGCNSWGSSTSTYDSTGTVKVTTMPWEAGSSTLKTLPTYDSYLNIYLNGGTYPCDTSIIGCSNGNTTINGWIENQNLVITNNIIEHLFNIGPLNGTDSLITNVSQESAYKWKGKVALINATDYVRASNNSLCTSVYKYTSIPSCYNNNSAHNWLFNSNAGLIGMLSLNSNPNPSVVWIASNTDGNTFGVYVSNYINSKPTFFIKSTITLTGKGTNDSNVYRIA